MLGHLQVARSVAHVGPNLVQGAPERYRSSTDITPVGVRRHIFGVVALPRCGVRSEGAASCLLGCQVHLGCPDHCTRVRQAWRQQSRLPLDCAVAHSASSDHLGVHGQVLVLDHPRQLAEFPLALPVFRPEDVTFEGNIDSPCVGYLPSQDQVSEWQCTLALYRARGIENLDSKSFISGSEHGLQRRGEMQSVSRLPLAPLGMWQLENSLRLQRRRDLHPRRGGRPHHGQPHVAEPSRQGVRHLPHHATKRDGACQFPGLRH
mmetsp:Transcript_10642/g.25285  ORF Transcript_10642/g.25285 Transcript_10642/m.25285 type:complete len:262 (-) Transcript_10642:420-1205(-)